MIPLFATRPALAPLIAEVAARQRAVLDSGRYILGPEVESFEAEFASYLGRRHCVGVANGTNALTIALRSLGVGPGDEVVIPAFTFFATAEAVVNAGARPVVADIDSATWCMTAETAAAALSPRTRALVPVHMFGNPAPMGELLELARERELKVVEDAAHAAGATLDGHPAGAAGDAACFSFYPAKNLGAFGDAGAIVSDDPELVAAARLLRAHGTEGEWRHRLVGFNSRLDELQAAGLRVLLPHLDAWTASRREAAASYRESALAELLTLQEPTAGARSAHHLFVGMTPGRDRLISSLAERGIEARAYYTVPMHRQPALAPFVAARECPHADRLCAEGIALPMGPALAAADVEAVIEAVAEALAPAGRASTEPA